MIGKLSITQRIYKAFVPAERFREVEAESRKWRATCKKCSGEISVWDTGGLVMRKLSENGGLDRCPHCGSWQQILFSRRED